MRPIISMLNNSVWCTLRPSPVHGIGVFAIRDIPQGQKLYCQEGGLTELSTDSLEGLHPAILKLVKQRWPNAPKQFVSPNQDARLISFMNHSKDANYSPTTDRALRDIEEGKEILEDYHQFGVSPMDK